MEGNKQNVKMAASEGQGLKIMISSCKTRLNSHK